MDSKVNLQKREDLKKKLLTAGAIGVGLIGLSSIANAASVFHRSEDGTMTNLTQGGGGGKDITGITVDAGGDALTTGVKGYIIIPNACTITGWSLVANTTGSIVFDIWKTNNAIPTVANTITASAKPTLSSAQLNSSTSVETWTTSIAAGDVLAYKIDSISTINRIVLTLNTTKT